MKIEDIIKEIESCEECKKIFPQKFRKRGYTFYADHVANYEFMMVLQNPLFNNKRHAAEKSEADRASSLRDRIKVHQSFFSKWFLSGPNKSFVKRFLELFKEKGLIAFDNLKDYVNGQFFSDFYVTDLIKYWCYTKEIKDNHRKHAIKHLRKEIEAVKPRLMLVFSTRVWDVFLKEFESEYNLQPIKGWKTIKKQGDPERSEKKLANAHGFLFQGRYDKNRKFFVLPLFHLSVNARYMLLRDSYFQYMKEGLEDYLKIVVKR